jgi:hypothetical protein
VTPLQISLLETGIFLFFLFLSGFWLSRAGKPYPGGRFNLHKFIGLGLCALLSVGVYQALQVAPFRPNQAVMVAITTLLFIINIIAGGLVSIERPMPGAVKLVHKVFPYLCALPAGVTIYFLESL